ncbi:UV radiation resistance-associated gene protein isoform X2 [Lethenteron reissneri]|uniref:UV radiation resistance-associated gene protein isoform X2 n=1 Tax=Lethenteron reissneri TaxID=7753 RepID=UPI002AB77489|nr:UV radiation resistance-associated gene protein isoform X2 [Lethenteron reissneri]
MNAADDKVARKVHVELYSQQRRLRHLRSISARNLVNPAGRALLDSYFTLHLWHDSHILPEFYTSEVIRDSLNPTWCSLDFGLMPDNLDTSVSRLVVRVYGGRGDRFSALIEWDVHLDGLRYVGPQIRADAPNSIVFGMTDGYYGTLSNRKKLADRTQGSLQVDENIVRTSYSVFSLIRLHTAQRAIKQTQATVKRVHRDIEERLRSKASHILMLKDREQLQIGISMLHSELKRQRQALEKQTDLLLHTQMELTHRAEELEKKRECLKQEWETVQKKRRKQEDKRSMLQKTNAQLNVRRRQIFSELAFIYPIAANDNEEHFICHIKLPNSDNFQAKDEASVSGALGFTAHLVCMVTLFLHVPLRYPVLHRGSKSRIRDDITDKLTDKDREFPLYAKGNERFHFDYGVYLLNKNIAQLRYYCSLSTPDLRRTLYNLRDLLESKLGVPASRLRPSVPQGSSVASAATTATAATPKKSDRGMVEWIKTLTEADKPSADRPTGALNGGSADAHAAPATRLHPADEADTPPPAVTAAVTTAASTVAPSASDTAAGPATPAAAAAAAATGSSGNVSSSTARLGSPDTESARDKTFPKPRLYYHHPASQRVQEFVATGQAEGAWAVGPHGGGGAEEVEAAVEADSDETVLGALDAEELALVHSELDEFTRRVHALSVNAAPFRRHRGSEAAEP